MQIFNEFIHPENEADVIKLIEAGVDANGEDDDKNNAMHIAAEYGYAAVIQKLIDKGYTDQINVPNKWGNTPLHRAVEFGFDNVVKILNENGAMVSVASNDGWTPLHYAAYKGSFQNG